MVRNVRPRSQGVSLTFYDSKRQWHLAGIDPVQYRMWLLRLDWYARHKQFNSRPEHRKNINLQHLFRQQNIALLRDFLVESIRRFNQGMFRTDRYVRLLRKLLGMVREASPNPVRVTDLATYEVNIFSLPKIAEGGFGVVCRHNKTAIKFCRADKSSAMSQLLREIEWFRFAAKALSRDFIAEHLVKVQGYKTANRYVGWLPVIVMPLQKCSLLDLFKDRNLKMQRLLPQIIDFCLVILVEFHNAGLIHGDIKPDNILVDKNFNLRLADFGNSRTQLERSDGGGTTYYNSQEVALNTRHKYVAPARTSANRDGFAFGVMLYSLLGGVYKAKQDRSVRILGQARTWSIITPFTNVFKPLPGAADISKQYKFAVQFKKAGKPLQIITGISDKLLEQAIILVLWMLNGNVRYAYNPKKYAGFWRNRDNDDKLKLLPCASI